MEIHGGGRITLRALKRSACVPTLEPLDRRELLTAGISAALNHGVLSVVGTSTKVPMVIDIYAVASPRGPIGYVVVEGVGLYPAAQVKTVAIFKPVAEPMLIRTSPRWNPSWRLTYTTQAPTPIRTPTPTPIRTPTPTPIRTPTPTRTASTVLESANEQAIVDAVNVVRRQNGLASLSIDPKLVAMAQLHAKDMARLQSMRHDLPGAAQPTLLDRANYVGYNFFTLGENIAYNYQDAASVMTGWMNSPGHRANILNSAYIQIGVGVAFDSTGAPYYCQVFGRPLRG